MSTHDFNLPHEIFLKLLSLPLKHSFIPLHSSNTFTNLGNVSLHSHIHLLLGFHYLKELDHRRLRLLPSIVDLGHGKQCHGLFHTSIDSSVLILTNRFEVLIQGSGNPTSLLLSQEVQTPQGNSLLELAPYFLEEEICVGQNQHLCHLLPLVEHLFSSLVSLISFEFDELPLAQGKHIVNIVLLCKVFTVGFDLLCHLLVGFPQSESLLHLLIIEVLRRLDVLHHKVLAVVHAFPFTPSLLEHASFLDDLSNLGFRVKFSLLHLLSYLLLVFSAHLSQLVSSGFHAESLSSHLFFVDEVDCQLEMASLISEAHDVESFWLPQALIHILNGLLFAKHI